MSVAIGLVLLDRLPARMWVSRFEIRHTQLDGAGARLLAGLLFTQFANLFSGLAMAVEEAMDGTGETHLFEPPAQRLSSAMKAHSDVVE